MRRMHPALIALLAGLLPAPASALFHIAHISEVQVSTADNPAGAQYVEIEMDFASQTFVEDSILSAWDCDGDFLGELLTVPGDVTNGGSGVRWIMATTTSLGGMTPDFGTASAGIPADCGQVCWGAPGLSVPAPGSWDHEVPNNYVDCVAYGGYTGTTRSLSGTPTPLVPNSGSANLSLTRVSLTNDNAADFALECATPENNAGATGDVVVEPCSNPTTTSTTVITTTTIVSGSTTTTIPGEAGQDLLPGKKILLKVKEGKPDKSSLLMLSQKSAETTIGRGEGTPDDPTQNGGRLLVASSPGGGFVDVYSLDAAGWKARTKKGEVSGWGFKDPDGPITSVSIKGGKSIAVKGKGTLGHDLDDDPNPVQVVLEIGEHRYCLEFGGTPKFKADKKYLATKASAPTACAEFPS